MQLSLRIAAVLLLVCAAFSRPAAGLSTKGNVLVDAKGKPIVFKGTTWYGFNVPNYGNFLGDMSQGVDSVSKDVRTGLWRQKMLGFNAIRLPFTFDILTRKAETFPVKCPVATSASVIASVLHPGFPKKVPPTQPPGIWGGVCNGLMPTDTAYNQYLWAVQYALYQGYYVQLDFHGNQYGDQSFYDTKYFVASWKQLLTDVLKLKGAKGRIMLDPCNEPDGYKCTWASCQGWGTLTNMYTQVFNALYPICSDCLFLTEGSGQSQGWSNYGDGFTTNQSTIAMIRSYMTGKGMDPSEYADATPFFQAIHNAKWQKQVVLAPHLYCPEVTGATDHFEGQGLFERLQWSFGDKQAQGFTYQGTTKKYSVLTGEFGSTLNNTNEVACMNSIIQYMQNRAPGYSHPTINSFFYWVWNPDSVDTGGLLTADWRTISWNKVDLLSKLGLKPWYKWAKMDRGRKLAL